VIPYADVKVQLRPMNHIAGFLGGGVPVFEIRDVMGPASNMLVSSPEIGHALAMVLGAHPVALMRGHGSVAAAQSVRHVVFRAVYTEVNARTESEAFVVCRLGEVQDLPIQLDSLRGLRIHHESETRSANVSRKRFHRLLSFGREFCGSPARVVERSLARMVRSSGRSPLRWPACPKFVPYPSGWLALSNLARLRPFADIARPVPYTQPDS